MKKHSIKNCTFGADIELFLINKSNTIVSAVGKVPGTKEEPVSLGKEGFAIERDNVSVEYLIPPADNMSQFFKNVQIGRDLVEKLLEKDGYKTFDASSYIFPKEELQTPESQEFGCDPDINVWTDKENPRPNGKHTNLRTNGYHIHIGYDFPLPSTSAKLVKALDLFLGVASLQHDEDTVRRNLYGRAGSHRIKSYGVEYRCLSSNMLRFDGVVEQGVMNAIEFINQGHEVTNSEGKIIIAAMNDAIKIPKAFELMEEKLNLITTKIEK